MFLFSVHLSLSHPPRQLHQQQLEQLQSAQQSRHNDEIAALQSQLDAANVSLSALSPAAAIAATVDASSGTAIVTVVTADAATAVDQASMSDAFTATDPVIDFYSSANRAIVASANDVDHVMAATMLANFAPNAGTATADPTVEMPVCAECAKHAALSIDQSRELEAARERVAVLEATLAAAQMQVCRHFWG